MFLQSQSQKKDFSMIRNSESNVQLVARGIFGRATRELIFLALAEDPSESFPYQLVVGAGVAVMALVLLAAVSFQCSSTWKWLMGVARNENQDNDDGEISQQNAIRISHSLPDLQPEPIMHEYIQEQKDGKKVRVPEETSLTSN